jgi:hypothetical protein
MLRMALVSLFIAATANAASPDCAGPENWPASMAFVHLKNAGITTNDRLDFTKTKITLLASELIGKDRYRQVHHVVFAERSGDTIEVITRSDASSEECSMGAVDVFVVSKHLGGP